MRKRPRSPAEPLLRLALGAVALAACGHDDVSSSEAANAPAVLPSASSSWVLTPTSVASTSATAPDDDSEVAPPLPDSRIDGDWCLNTSALARDVQRSIRRAEVGIERALEGRGDPGGIASIREHERVRIQLRGASVHVRYGGRDEFGPMQLGEPVEIDTPDSIERRTYVADRHGTLIELIRLDDGEETVERRFSIDAHGDLTVLQQSLWGEAHATLTYRPCRLP